MRILFILAILCHQHLCAQLGPADEILGKLRIYDLTLGIKPACTSGLPLSSIKIIDLRFDTSKLGYIRYGQTFRKVVAGNSFASEVQTRFNSLCSRSPLNPSSQLIVFFRHFWVQATDASEANNNKADSYDADPLITCKITAECFLQIDTLCYPVLRYDSVYTYLKNGTVKLDDAASFALAGLYEQLEKVNWERRSKKMTEKEMFAFASRYRQTRRTYIPTEPGIYLTFSDFKKGNLLKAKIEINHDITDELYIVVNGEKKLMTDFWGYTDGTVEYMNTGMNFYMLVRTGDGYDIFGKKTLMRHIPPPQNNQSLLGNMLSNAMKPTGNVKHSRPWQLNMETGELY